MSEQISFTWLPFFNEMLTVICNQYNPQTLVPIFKQIFPKQKDEEIQGIKTDFKEIDPLTFIACFNRNETKENRIAFCKTAKEILHLNTPVPADFDGIPAFNNQKTWFLQYSYLRGKGDCTILWNFAKQRVSSHPITEEEMTQILSLKQIGLVKICSFLFICFPTTYYPVDSNSCTFLGLQKEDTFTFFDQLQKVAKEKYPNLQPYELSYQAWKDASAPIKNTLNYWGVGSIWYGNGGDQRERFLANSLWESGYEKDGINKYQQRLDAVNIGDIFVLKTTATDGKDHKHPISYIKNIGIVESRINKYSFRIKWLDLPALPYRLEGKSLWDTIAPIKDATIINTIKNLMKSKPEIGIAATPRQFPLNQILYGPPGTGKTYHTITKAVEIIDGQISPDYTEAKKRFDELKAKGQIKFITFHQNYSYEDFMVGIRPDLQNGQISYKLHEGPFKKIADEARKIENKDKKYVLIIDEINRGNISKIFGELITLIETDKRAGNKHALSAPLLYQNEEFSVPNNLYIIGTMNTADKSIALVDIALRRRFVFEEMMPNAALLNKVEGFDLPGWFTKLNQKITAELDRDHQIGHSYFIGIETIADLQQAFYQCILPLLKEYFYGNPEKLKEIIPGFTSEEKLEGDAFINALNQNVKTDTDERMG